MRALAQGIARADSEIEEFAVRAGPSGGQGADVEQGD